MGASWSWCCYLGDDDEEGAGSGRDEAHVALVRTRGRGRNRSADADPDGIAEPIRASALSAEDVALVGSPSGAGRAGLRARKSGGSSSSSGGGGGGGSSSNTGASDASMKLDLQGRANTSASSSAAITTSTAKADLADALAVEGKEIEEEKEETRLQLVSVGIIGTGRSSTINTLLNSSSACKVSGGQLRGTRGFAVAEKHTSAALPGHRALELDYIDCEGLRRDKNVDAAELNAHLTMLARAMAQLPGARVSHIVFTLDLEDRQNAPTVLNLLTLVEAFRDVRTHCFLCMTKWNSNAVQAEWNTDLREYTRANRRAKSTAGLKGSPPTPSQMRQSYLDYLATSFKPKTEEVAREKLERVLDFFQDRVFWAYNLDSLQLEDREEGELGPMFEHMFATYRDEAIKTLTELGAAPVSVESIELVRALQLQLKLVLGARAREEMMTTNKKPDTAQANACMNALLTRYEQRAPAAGVQSGAAAGENEEQKQLQEQQRQKQQQQQQQQQQEESGRNKEVEQKPVAHAKEADGEEKDYFIHTVSPSDTLGGLELRYGVSGSLIRRLNGMTSDRLNAYLHLKIPKVSHTKPTHLAPSLVVDKKTEKMQILRVFRITFPEVGEHEVECYMRSAKGSVREALRLCRQDIEWERKNKKLLKTRSKHNDQLSHGPEQDIKPSKSGFSSFFWKSSSSAASSPSSSSSKRDARRKAAEDLPESGWPSIDDMLLANDPDGPRVSLLQRDYLPPSPQMGKLSSSRKA
ncbi:Hypothetical Protein FCC1311_049142 [Hondaea fermentalgiana]|uniref:LysM domain-containing protein n=1 Tax=Hondaea fermentalgiana TaxID=2315210 RepID=A0A2R5GJ63_9STRA|nr:Hypothetical Protein FCC1311_049142 [Hondaea fermentalgiana]|eukprot:GBG28693.1 Hypothetical Protein FCC1311_049142 [Hondaea fermentalgiana]